MNSNPYEPPKDKMPARSVQPVMSRAEVLEIASAHRGMMWMAAGKLGVDFTYGAALELMQPPFQYAYYAIALAVLAGCAFFVFRLANAVYGAGPAIVCALLTLAPCAGMLAILIIGGNAQDVLRKRGVKVGFMGANKLQIRELEAALDEEFPSKP